jgi:signal transduction histidine kinase
MHDSLGHGLVVVNVKLEVAQRLYAVEPIRGDAELEASRVLIREMMSELRRSLANLRTPLLDHHDLSAALRRMAKEVGDRTTLTVTCTTPTNLPMIPANTAEAIWRIACEALTNVEQHAAAGSVAVALEQAHESLILRVTDDGAGITPGSETRYGHYGIIGMRERAALFGGTVQITVRPSGGTIVEAHIPIEWNSLR